LTEKTKNPYIAKKLSDMTKQGLINWTIEALEKLPEDKVSEIAEFADFVLKKYEEQIIQKGIETLVSKSDSFAFLTEEEDLYDESDLKEKY
jgi:predicted peroxiredoxin